MLVLSRKPNESIMIGDDVKIYVLTVSGNNVRIGIDAPLSTAVHRQEIYDAIRANEASGEVAATRSFKSKIEPRTKLGSRTRIEPKLPPKSKFGASFEPKCRSGRSVVAET